MVDDSYLWNFGDGLTSESFEPQHLYTYDFLSTNPEIVITLSAVNEFGCIDSIDKIVVIYNLPLIFPNVITPNNDGYNDFFVIQNAEKIKSTVLSIYDRWGKLIYRKENYMNEWNGDEFPSGTYYYVFEYLKKEYHSSLTIIK